MISLAGIVLLLVQLGIFFFSSNNQFRFFYLFLIAIIVSGFIDIGYFAHLGGQTFFSLKIECVVVVALSALFLVKDIKLPREACLCIFLIVLVVSIAYFFIISNSIKDEVMVVGSSWDDYLRGSYNKSEPIVSRQSIFALIQLLLYLFIFSVAYSVMEKKLWKKLLHMLVIFVKCYIAICILEAIIKNVFESQLFNMAENSFFGVSLVTYSGIAKRGGLYMLQGFSKEPSIFCVAMFYAFIILLYARACEKDKSAPIWIVISMVLVLASTSLIGVSIVVAEALIALVLYYVNGNKRIAIGVFIVSLVLIVGIAVAIMASDSYWSERFGNVIAQFEKIMSPNWYIGAEYSSELARFGSIADSLRLLAEYPLTGIGFGISHCQSYLVNAALNLGIIGLAAWLYLQFKCFGNNIWRSSRAYYLVVVIWIANTLLYGGDLRFVYGMECLAMVVALKAVFSTGKEKKSVIYKTLK